MQSVGISDNYIRKYIFDVAEENNVKEQNIPELVKNLSFPSSWTSLVTLNQYIDTPMHLLFQGIVKSVIEFSFNYLKDNNKKQIFKNDLFDYMYHIKLLQCDFCRMDTFSKSSDTYVSGWIAEHYLAISRCFVPVFSHVLDMIDTGDDIINLYYDLMIQSLMCMIYRLMSPHQVSEDIIMNYIKCFLQSVHHFEDYSNTGSNNMSWFARGNFLSLLNLPDQMKQFGSLRWYWEGSRERHIQYVKPLMKNMRNTVSYLKHQFHKMQQSNNLEHIADMVQNNMEKQTIYKRYNNMKFYASEEILIDHVEALEPIMCMYDEKSTPTGVKKMFCLMKNSNDKYHKVDIICDDDVGFYKSGIWYSSISLRPLDILNDQFTLDEFTIKGLTNVIGIPLVKISNNNSFYAFFTESWLIRSCQGHMCLPNLCPTLVSKIIETL